MSRGQSSAAEVDMSRRAPVRGLITWALSGCGPEVTVLGHASGAAAAGGGGRGGELSAGGGEGGSGGSAVTPDPPAPLDDTQTLEVVVNVVARVEPGGSVADAPVELRVT